jgi:hypothetical protein
LLPIFIVLILLSFGFKNQENFKKNESNLFESFGENYLIGNNTNSFQSENQPYLEKHTEEKLFIDSEQLPPDSGKKLVKPLSKDSTFKKLSKSDSLKIKEKQDSSR